MSSRCIAIFLWSFLTGLVTAHSFALPQILVVGLTLVGLVMLGLGGVNYSSKLALAKYLAAICLGTSLGVLVWTGNIQRSQFEQFIGQSVNTEGVVIAWPNITASGNQALLIQPDGYTQALRASLRRPISVRPNDRVWIRGQVKQPENFSEFNYVSYLQKNNVFAELDKSKVVVIQKQRSWFGNLLSGLRQWIIATTNSRLDINSSSLVLGTLIGYSEDLPKAMAEAFKKSGLTHILVASGFNLTIIASSVGIVGWFFGRRFSDITSLGVVWFFVVLTGSSGSVVRAGIMVSLVLVGRAVGRLPSSYYTLLLAVVVMVLFNPMQLFYDIGFQLSVGATLGVLEANKLRVYLERDGWLTELLWPTMGAIFVTAPIISLYFSTFSIIAPLANLLVLPLVEFVMLFGALSLLPVINALTVPITELIVTFQMKITVFLAGWKYSSVSVKSSMFFVLGYYVLLFLARESFYLRAKKSRLKNNLITDKITKIII